LPGVTAPAALDYLAYDPIHGRVWVPVGNTGSADVLEIASSTFTRVDGFKTAEREIRGKKRMLGPSAVSVGEGFAYVGNRASSEVCPVDASTLALGKCLTLPSATDGVAYVSSAKEVWVTTPRDQSIAVLDASNAGTLKQKTSIKLDGDPEGYAVDVSRGVFFTNLEDKDRTVAIDIKTHKPKATWSPGCGAQGPRGIAAEIEHGLVIVACTDHVVVLDGAHGGAAVGQLDTGAGVDNIDWLEARRLLVVGAAKAGKLTAAHMDAAGALAVAAVSSTPVGARNAVVDASGNVYEADPQGAQLLVFPSPGH
jgi:DNA-binding beta-propeller fold protein YncE